MSFSGFLRKIVSFFYGQRIVIFFRKRHYHRFDSLSAQTVAGDTNERFPGWFGHG